MLCGYWFIDFRLLEQVIQTKKAANSSIELAAILGKIYNIYKSDNLI